MRVEQESATALFAYGTLRRGAPMHGLLEGRTSWLGPASAPGRLVDLGAFPGLVPAAAPGDRVRGDLFAIAEADREGLLDALDRYEGASFERVQQRVEGPHGSALAWLYTYRGAVDGFPVLAGGDYLAR
ncbi:MAG TPA: gamma-glutamylcyclotransferase family protein [Myxococcota bacterium]|nr:gamma-glutamylcyclotransferase family protein [Myxococcota bacterium]